MAARKHRPIVPGFCHFSADFSSSCDAKFASELLDVFVRRHHREANLGEVAAKISK